MKSQNWPYMAGIIDGEGCFHIARITPYGKQVGYRLDIHITTTSHALAKYLVSHFGGKFYYIPMKNPKWKDAYRWQPSGKANKEKLILGVLPHLVIKRDLAMICLEFLRLGNLHNVEQRELLCQKARELSRRGRSVETDTLDSGGEVYIPYMPLATEMIQPELQSDLESAPVGTLTA